MKHPLEIPGLIEDEGRSTDHLSPKDDTTQGSEFLDDSLRMEEQPFRSLTQPDQS